MARVHFSAVCSDAFPVGDVTLDSGLQAASTALPNNDVWTDFIYRRGAIIVDYSGFFFLNKMRKAKTAVCLFVYCFATVKYNLGMKKNRRPQTVQVAK